MKRIIITYTYFGVYTFADFAKSQNNTVYKVVLRKIVRPG